MITLAWFARRKPESEKIFELEEFLRSVARIKDEELQALRQAGPARQAAPTGPARPEPSVGPYKVSGQLGERRRPSKAVVPSEPPAAPKEPTRPGLDERLDEALVETFPASDPIAVSAAS
jgi:hypothetical protein